MDETVVRRFFHIMHNVKKLTLNNTLIGKLSRSEFAMLQIINHYEVEANLVTTSILSEKLYISKPAVSQMVNILEDKQYVERIIEKHDRRIFGFKITDLGRRELEVGNKIFFDKLSKIFDELGIEDTNKLLELIEKYYIAVKKLAENDQL